LEADYKITFASTAIENEFTANLNVLRIQKVQIELNSPSFNAFITDLQPDIVLFDRFLTEL